MRRINLTLVLVLLAVAPTATAKVGVEFQQDPQTVAPGERQDISVMVMGDPPSPGGELGPIVGRRPLVTFANVKTGEVVRVRAGRTNAEGIARASVTFPSRGEWTIEITGVPGLLDEGQQSVPIGVPFSSTSAGRSLPPEVIEPPAQPSATSDEGRAPWPVLPLAIGLGIAAMAAGALVLRRREAGA